MLCGGTFFCAAEFYFLRRVLCGGDWFCEQHHVLHGVLLFAEGHFIFSSGPCLLLSGSNSFCAMALGFFAAPFVSYGGYENEQLRFVYMLYPMRVLLLFTICPRQYLSRVLCVSHVLRHRPKNCTIIYSLEAMSKTAFVAPTEAMRLSLLSPDHEEAKMIFTVSCSNVAYSAASMKVTAKPFEFPC